ncbi:MAG: phosphoribosylformylglycinamidine synthase subunit PurL [Planctomycetes bacterium]|nr:phosphoribosylformylglycinamidine synthase subunit PurL [Planctomycetota bacterium]
MTLWEIDIYPGEGQPDRLGDAVAGDAADLELASDLSVTAARGFLVQGELDETQAIQLARELFADGVVERTVVARAGDQRLSEPPNGKPQLLHVMLKPGVMDPVADSALNAIADFGMQVEAVRTFRKFWIPESSPETVSTLSSRILANDSIEQVVVGALELNRLQLGSPYEFKLLHVAIRDLDNDGLTRLSREGQLYLTLVEMQTIQNYFRELGRDPTDAELESIAQTWSEHCSHKTLAGRIAYRDENGEQRFENMLKETIFAATGQIRRDLGEDDWCVSVFEDNAGIVRFDEDYNVVFKVETHNHPSALEPYGGANTGIGGVIRDPMGTGLGAKPICNTDVFCFAPPDISTSDLPPGVLHPRRVMKGVVSGVRDYGNRMGIPTVNGAIYFDDRYLGNPLVYCGDVGLIPRDKSSKEVMAGDWIVSVGGRTGRDGIHGATFSSAELTSESESLSGGAVQIGNAITEKMVLDVIMQARDRGLYSAVTDCGAGGFSSAVGEMGEKTGAEVWLDKAPVKYDGLSYTEVWISEAQERMVLSVPPENWDEFESLCRAEGVEASIIGKFVATGRLQLKYNDNVVADLPMELLHDGRPPIVRDAVYEAPASVSLELPAPGSIDLNATLAKILGSLNVASKEWVIRQYDHEVQGGSVIKPLVGVENDGPGDAAVVRPVLNSYRGLAVSCGMNPHYGDFDTYHMAASAIDEAIRNCVAVGADPSHISILDNFCWGYTDRPETLGSLVRAALACRDLAVAFGTPFISGKDSLNNEFSYEGENGKQTISIPPSLLISAMGQVDDVRKCVTMDLKEVGNSLYIIGLTRNELGGSHFTLVERLKGGNVPEVNTDVAKRTFAAIHQAIQAGCLRACHDLSEGGLAVGIAEMAFAGGLGAAVSLANIPNDIDGEYDVAVLFAESNSRFICEVAGEKKAEFEPLLNDLPYAEIGEVTDTDRVAISGTSGESLIDSNITDLKESWQSPLRW